MHVRVPVATAYALHGIAPPLLIVTLGEVLVLPAAALMRALVEEPARRLARRAERTLGCQAAPAARREAQG